MITRSCIERIKDSVDIYDVVSPYVTLKKCGSNWRGLSPFNKEKTPSFFVMPTKKIFRCFSSGQAGDIFRFVQLCENVSFREAVEMIASKFNVALEFETAIADERRLFSKQALFDIHQIACDFFVKNFYSKDAVAQKMRKYWTEIRGFSLDVARKNDIGFGGNFSEELMKILRDKGFTLDALKASGIFYCKDDDSNFGKCLMRFVSRLTIPIRDIQGRVVGFSARAVDGITPKDRFFDAKYINSPETEIFHKGNLLFGLNKARQFVTEHSGFWLVEGQFDAMRLWNNGISVAIAPQGTAITDAQLAIMRRYTSRLNCMLDGDSAGLKAAERILPMSVSAGLDVKFFVLPEGQDPDSFFKEDFESKIKNIEKSGLTEIQFLTSRNFQNSQIGPQAKSAVLAKIYDIIAKAETSVARNSYLEELASEVGSDRRAIIKDFENFISERKSKTSNFSEFDIKPVVEKKVSSAEGQLLAITLLDVKIAKKITMFIDEQFLQCLSSTEGKFLLKILNEIRESSWDGVETLSGSQLFSEDEKNLIFMLMADFDGNCDLLSAANRCLEKLFRGFVRKEMDEINRKIRQISLDEREMIKNLQHGRLVLRNMLRSIPRII